MRAVIFVFWSLAFGVAFTQWPLYSENQDTKFLHGLARAGYAMLNQDWLANTLDPLPPFSWLVSLTYGLLHQTFFYLYHALLLGVYLFSVLGIASHVFPLRKSQAGQIVFLVIVIALHATLLPPFSLPLLGTSLGWLLQAGVAGQYLFNPVFQPSTFGVLLIASIYLFLRGQPYWATLLAAVAAVFHSAYLPSAAVLAAAYALITLNDGWRSGRKFWPAFRPALGIGLLALVVVTPILIYNALVFAPTTAELWRRSQDIIVNFRIPQHSLPELWLDNTVFFKVGLVSVALVLVRKSRLLPIMLLAFLVAVLGTAAEMLTGNDTLAFVAPWRISAFLVPLASVLIVGWLVATIFERFRRPLARLDRAIVILSLIALAVLVARGGLAMRDSFQARRQSDRYAMFEFVRRSRAPGQVYLTDTSMAEFRLATGAAQFVTFKSHPYKDVEVIEWQDRLLAANDFYADPTCDKLAGLAARYKITDVVLGTDRLPAGCPATAEVYRDGGYRVLRIGGATSATTAN